MATAVADTPIQVPLAPSAVDRAISRDKHEGLRLAIRARLVVIAALAPLMVYLSGAYESLYYLALLVLFGAIGWAQLSMGRVGRSRTELLLLVLDVLFVTAALVIPNPLRSDVWPEPMQFRYGGAIYFTLILATAVLAYSWRTLIFLAGTIILTWSAALVWTAMQPIDEPELRQRVFDALAGSPHLAHYLDPYSLNIPNRVQELVVIALVAATLATAGWRSQRLLHRQAAAERERFNLSRYFSPNVVELIANNDQPLATVRAQKVAVLFVDIVGFTAYADEHEPAIVISTLRSFLERMEREVFRHEGTLDKYLGDGLMATFGTPVPGPNDAVHALRCGCAMLAAIAAWNEERAARGEPALAIGVGIHYGPVVTGDIGANRLELAVIGATVNIASRLEAHTRVLNVSLIASRDLIEQARSEPDWTEDDTQGLEPADPQVIRGVAEPVHTWTLSG
ncbi:MAG: adenylate/guanylate cyclase domain-containing protein [Hyphomicrobiaceae bacterium]